MTRETIDIDRTPRVERQDGTPRPGSRRRAGIGWVVAGSLTAGLAVSAVLVLGPFVPAEDSAVTGAVLCGFAFGWAMLAVLSVLLTDQPQRWAAAPAAFMAAGGLLLVVFGPSADEALSWIWPPAALALAVWTVIRAHRQLRSRSRRWLVYPVMVALALASIGGAYRTGREAASAKAHPVPGRLIDVGGHRLHLNCTGSGAPTVVLEPGAGGMSSSMGWIAPAVGRDTRVCVYDRAGRGWSESADTPQDAAQIAGDLHTLLQRGEIPGPYVLAGHSFGGLYALTFAARYPDEVAGMVLVDSTAPAATEPESQGSTGVRDRIAALLSATARVGLGQLSGLGAAGGLPPESRDQTRAGLATARAIRSTIDEYAQGSASAREAASLTSFADKPLIVLTAGSGHDAAWSAAQNKLAALSTNSAHRTVPGATHAAMVADEKPATATTRAILDVVASVRGATPLGR